MIRRLLALTSALSLLLAVTTAVLWVRSYWRADDWFGSRTTFDGHFIHRLLGAIYSERGGFKLLIQRLNLAYGPDPVEPGKTTFFQHTSKSASKYPQPDDAAIHTHCGCEFHWEYDDAGGGDGYVAYLEVTLPCPMLFLLFTVGSVLLSAAPIRKRMRKRMGRCVHCGYDLRASPACCPECGTAISS